MRQVVGLVENPLNLHDDIALLAPGQVDPPAIAAAWWPGRAAARGTAVT